MKNQIKMRVHYIVRLLIILTLASCKKDDANTLTVTSEAIDFSPDGGSVNFDIQTNAKSWNIDNPAADWLSISVTSGTLPTTTISAKVATRTLTARSTTLTITAGNAHPKQIVVTQPASDHLFVISSATSTLEFKHTGETKSFTITTDDAQWTVSANTDWLHFDKESGIKGTTVINVTALESVPDAARTATITVTGDHASPLGITVTQKASLYPTYNTSSIAPDQTGMSNDVVQLAAKIKLGWNIGNTLEAIGAETAWGNPMITKSYVDAIKNLGFNSVRLPCSWNYYADPNTAKIKQVWLDRVKEVVQYCIDNDMYVLLNIHWDQGWLENNITLAKKDSVNAKQKAFWEQIATEMRGFDEHLMFASANEPNAADAAAMTILLSYHQTFVNAVRSTGGRNSYRTLVVQGASALMNTFPTDQVPNRIMFEEHCYTPYQFTLMTEDANWGNMFYYWGAGNHSTIEPTRNSTWGEEGELTTYFQGLKSKFVDKGIPVLMGEYLAIERSKIADPVKHEASRTHWLNFVTKTAIANGVLPFVWDTGGIVDRNTGTVKDQPGLDAIIAGGK